MEKTKNIIILVLAVFLAISLYSNFQPKFEASQNESVDIKKVTPEELFNKKQECAKYKLQLEKKLKEEYFESSQTGAQMSHYLEKIFYSPKANSCLYIENEWTLINGKLTFEAYNLRDVLTGETIVSSLLERGNPDYFSQKQVFDDAVKIYE